MGKGKFTGCLLVSDYDDTLYDHTFHVPERNRAAVRHFIAEGGRFTIATGRAYATFTPQIARERLEFNAPVVLGNGSAIYDYQAGEYLVRTSLPPETPERLAELCAVFPGLGFEVYHGEDVFAYNPNFVTKMHMERVGAAYTVRPAGEIPLPWSKVILEQDGPFLEQVQRYLLERYGTCYEAIFSNQYLLEVTDKGANKGGMVERIVRHLELDPRRVYCIGDNQNDIPMLALSAVPFAPANCAQAVKDWGARVLCHCDEGAVAEAVGILDEICSEMPEGGKE